MYTQFIETEVLPRVTKGYGVVLTTDPEGRATMGGIRCRLCLQDCLVPRGPLLGSRQRADVLEWPWRDYKK